MMSRIAIDRGLSQEAAFIILSDYYQTDTAGDTLESLCMQLGFCMRRMLEAAVHNRSGSSNGILHPALRYLQSHYNEPISLERLAYELSVSPWYLSRIFRQRQGEQLHSF